MPAVLTGIDILESQELTTKEPMATKPKPAPSTSRAIANWDEELAKLAAAAAQTEASTATGNFFSVKSGVLSWNDSPLLNNEMAVIILDSIFENVFYGSDYDPDNPQGPQCFAFGREEKTLAPHESVVELGINQHLTCHGCPKNEFGTADRGKGKACRNVRRLGLISAGTFTKSGDFNLEEDENSYVNAEIGFLKLPVTSVKGYAAYVKTTAATLKRPPLGVITKIKVIPDAVSQFKVTFEALGNVPNEIMATILKRRAEAAESIESPYKVEEAVVAPPPKRGAVKAPAKTAAKRKF